MPKDRRLREDIADGLDVERRFAAGDIEVLYMPYVPEHVADMPVVNVEGFGIATQAVGADHIATPGDLDGEIFKIEFSHG